MITFDITLPGGQAVPLTIHNKEILKMFMEHKGKLIEFIDMAIKELQDDESDIVIIKLKESIKTILMDTKDIIKQIDKLSKEANLKLSMEKASKASRLRVIYYYEGMLHSLYNIKSFIEGNEK